MSDFYDHKDDWYRIELNLNEHKDDTIKHITDTERSTWNAKSDAHDHPYAPLSHVGDATHLSDGERESWNKVANASYIVAEQYAIPVTTKINDVDTIIGQKWYRKWSNGYIEQGGYINAYATATLECPIEFAIEFATTDYTIFLQECVSTVNGSTQTWPPLERFDVRTVSGTTVHFCNAYLVDTEGNPHARLSWSACGI